MICNLFAFSFWFGLVSHRQHFKPAKKYQQTAMLKVSFRSLFRSHVRQIPCLSAVRKNFWTLHDWKVCPLQVDSCSCQGRLVTFYLTSCPQSICTVLLATVAGLVQKWEIFPALRWIKIGTSSYHKETIPDFGSRPPLETDVCPAVLVRTWFRYSVHTDPDDPHKVGKRVQFKWTKQGRCENTLIV